jgi:cellulose biosynthesis protein BcsQ
VREHLKELHYPVFDTVLHLYVAYKEAMAAGLSVIEYDPKSKAAQEMAAFFHELEEVLN